MQIGWAGAIIWVTSALGILLLAGGAVYGWKKFRGRGGSGYGEIGGGYGDVG